MFKSRNDTNVVYACTIQLLEDSDIIDCEFQVQHKGNFLLDYICEQLNIVEKDYFGLRYVNFAKQRYWLDLTKSIFKQLKDIDPVLLSFRVKFYPADPFRLTGNAKLILYQQLKRDLRHGRLYCSAGEAAALGSLIVQEETGDYDPNVHTKEYISNLKLSLRQTDELQQKIIELHKKRDPRQEPQLAINEFLLIARGLETYGVDYHLIKDHRGNQLYLGINHSGISTFSSGRRIQHFRWNEVHKLNFEGKMFIAHLTYTDRESREPKKHTVGFKCPTGTTCSYVWRCAIEQMLFFTLSNSRNASVMSGGGFMRSTKFRYSGRTEREILTESLNALKQQHLLSQGSPKKRKANSVPATPSSPQPEITEIRYCSLPRSTMSEPLECPEHMLTYPFDDSTPQLEPVSEENRRYLGSGHIGMLNYFRDSLDHSSTESGFTTLIENLPNDKHADHDYQQKQQKNICLINQQNAINIAKSSSKKFSLINAFIPSLIFVVLSFIVTAIFILESDSEMLTTFKRWPEMISLRYQYYQPLKEFLYNAFESN